MQSFCAISAFLKISSFTGCKTPSFQVEQDFMTHIAEFGFSYGTKEEYKFRLQQFKKIDAEIKKVNTEKKGFTLGHNMFSTWTDDEYKKILGDRPLKKDIKTADFKYTTTPAASIDWRQEGAVNAVKNQLHCGSCWTFATVAVLETQEKIRTNNLPILSEQQIVDCDHDDVEGCDGGLAISAL
jgi:C1A family cysteine protease